MFQRYVPPSFHGLEVQVPDPRRQAPPFVNAFGQTQQSTNLMGYAGVVLGLAVVVGLALWLRR